MFVNYTSSATLIMQSYLELAVLITISFFHSVTHTHTTSLFTNKPVISGLGDFYDYSTHSSVHLCSPSHYALLTTLHEPAPFLSPLLQLYVGAFKTSNLPRSSCIFTPLLNVIFFHSRILRGSSGINIRPRKL